MDWLHPVCLDGLDVVQHQPEGGLVIVLGDNSVLLVLAWPFSSAAHSQLHFKTMAGE